MTHGNTALPIRKRKTDDVETPQPISSTYTSTAKRAFTDASKAESMDMDSPTFHTPSFPINSTQQQEPARPKTPPLGMTLAHYDASSGGYTASVVKSSDEINSNICTGMTPTYRPPMERWGSCFI